MNPVHERYERARAKVASLHEGQRVRTPFREDEKDVVRTIISIVDKPKAFGSGRGVMLSGGDPCPHCHKADGRPIDFYIDASWCHPVEEET